MKSVFGKISLAAVVTLTIQSAWAISPKDLERTLSEGFKALEMPSCSTCLQQAEKNGALTSAQLAELRLKLIANSVPGVSEINSYTTQKRELVFELVVTSEESKKSAEELIKELSLESGKLHGHSIKIKVQPLTRPKMIEREAKVYDRLKELHDTTAGIRSLALGQCVSGTVQQSCFMITVGNDTSKSELDNLLEKKGSISTLDGIQVQVHTQKY